jgi:hypothetical protein
MRTTIAAIALLILIGHPAHAQQVPPAIDTSRGLLISFADGRMHTKPLRPKGGIWTANFPKIPGVKPSHEGLPLSVIDIRHVVEGSEVVVTVSLSYGAPNKNQVTVATVRLLPGASVKVTELRAYGVEPISLAIVSLPSTPANIPEMVSPSTLLDVRAEQSGPNASSYRVVLTNRSDLPLMWVRFQGYRDGKLFTGGQGGPRNTPLVNAKSEHGFEIAIGPTGFVAGTEPHAWSPIDRIEITSLMWQDGTVEGDRQIVLQRTRAEEQRSSELRMLIDALAAGRGEPTDGLRSRIASLAVKSVDVQESVKSLTADLDSLVATGLSRDNMPLDGWLGSTIKLHQEWLNRIVVPRIER